MGDEELVALVEAAKEIGKSREWLRVLVRDGMVRHVRIGRTIGIPRAEIRRLKHLPEKRGGWPKGKPRKLSPYRYPEVGEHASAHLVADRRPTPPPPA